MGNWEEMTPPERDRWIHAHVMLEQLDVPCTDGQIDLHMGSYWGCTCGWKSDFHAGEDKSTAHTKPIPRYNEDWNATWAAFQRVMEIGYSVALREELKRIWRLPINNPIFLIEDFARLTPALLCQAIHAATMNTFSLSAYDGGLLDG